MFNKKRVEIWDKGEQVHLGGGVYQPSEPKLTYEGYVNIQPYSSAEVKRDYGFDLTTTHTMFSKKDIATIGNSIVRYNDEDYEVKEKIVWNNYVETLLERK